MAGPKPLTEVKFIAVHCSATPGNRDIGAKELDRMHRDRGFRCIGYHYVIRRDGTVEKGRPDNQPGAHVEDWNHCSLGICLVGGVDAKLKPEPNFTPAQMDGLNQLLTKLEEDHPLAVIQGHRDFSHVNKACPSFDVKHWLATGTLKP
ncbi:N-acetylmuramoyl-L-alanine amidase [Rhizobacter sp. Root1221]|uniref:N-acetylmuramoyl-L-alanine amidase n=1 Tax=Rhizobacter sp. Root1221 TaxID=1736433 RepID=UPI0006F991C5|nr:N-acetylmuramoyl-L-alanine amidase [Rhizobacter sp. Root1221]KQW02234.1 lysozyme [Rhizobacter sp. Root1221]